jgi:hypothetical protein
MFKQWGMPLAIRTDNGHPFGCPTRDVVPIMSLWLKSWGITPVLNPPRSPQSNAKVERAQGTSSRWAELKKAQNLEDLQSRIDKAIIIQRETFPVKRLGNVSRAKLYQKDLYAHTRTFDQTLFNAEEGFCFLAKATFIRKVDSQGTTNNYGKSFQIGQKYKGQFVVFKFNETLKAWNVSNAKAEFLKSFDDERFSDANLFDLSICQ